MTISSRTPEGYPSHCPLCGAATHLEYSEPTEDAPCPSCGHLLWRSANLLSHFQQLYAGLLGTNRDLITIDTPLIPLDQDSLDQVEWIMNLEEEFDIDIPDEIAGKVQTIGDLIRAIEEQRRKSHE